MDGSPEDFARTIGDALDRFLKGRRISQKEASEKMLVELATLNRYTHDYKGKRTLANAEVFVKACVALGFEFEYKGHRISASELNSNGTEHKAGAQQLSFDYEGQFELADEKGTLSVSLKRPPGGVELSVSLKAVS